MRWERAGPGASAIAPMSVAALGLGAPLLLAPFDDTYLGFAIRRGVHQESVAASIRFVILEVSGRAPVVEFRYRNLELLGAGPYATATLVLFGGLAALVAARAWRASLGGSRHSLVLVTHALLLCALCAGKVLSPQYLVLGAPLAAHLGGRRAVAWTVIAAMTMVPFTSYSRGEGFMALIALRNALLVVETVAVARAVLRAARADWNRAARSARIGLTSTSYLGATP